MSSLQVPLVVLGDHAYPALTWLMKPYPETAHITDCQKHYNYHQSQARMVVENAYGRLKCRWRCLLKRLDVKLENVPNIVSACVILCNGCEEYGDKCQEDWIDHTQGNVPQQPPTVISSGTNTTRNIRDAIMIHVSQKHIKLLIKQLLGTCCECKQLLSTLSYYWRMSLSAGGKNGETGAE